MEQLCSTPPPPENNYINILAEYFARLLFLVRFSLFFPLAHSPKRQRCIASQTVFREKEPLETRTRVSEGELLTHLFFPPA